MARRADFEDAVKLGAAIPLRKVFNFQSFFSSTLLEQGILVANPAEPLIASTVGNDGVQPLAGVGFALHPASQTVVGVLPRLGGSASVVTLKPGQVYYPGVPFEGFTWGLPVGWLGGGAALLYLLREKVAETFWTGAPEVIFHRARFKTFAITDNPAAGAAGANANWPVRFPWPNAISGVPTPAVPQTLGPQIGMVPTKFVLRLRLATLIAAAKLRLIWNQTEDFDLQSDGVTYDAFSTSGSFVEVTFDPFAASGFQIGGVASAEFPIQTVDDKISRIGGDPGTLFLVSMDGNIATGSLIDIVRYGLVGG